MKPLIQTQTSICADARVIFDVGAQDGATSHEYLAHFPSAHVYAFEPQVDNFRSIKAAPRLTTVNAAIAERTGEVTLNVNTHSGTHSLLEIGDVRYWMEPATTKARETVPAYSLDDFCRLHRIGRIDILKMDIQGAELMALRGATQMLADRRINLLALEVEFKPLYRDQPLCADIQAHLDRFGYRLEGFYEPCVVAGELSWADAIFTAA